MTDTFVPLIAGGIRPAGSKDPARLKSASSSTPAFTPATPPKAEAAPQKHCEPKITVERQGETITHIRVECGCGEVIELKCEY